ncbi:hypothetical protein X975_10176, partial [Stegodyphus mimosarum]
MACIGSMDQNFFSELFLDQLEISILKFLYVSSFYVLFYVRHNMLE